MHSQTMPNRSPSGSILKKPKNNGNYDAATNMHTIKEYDRNDFNSSFQENENVMNMSANTLSMSVKDPSRPPKVIEGLTDFLQDEYSKRLGVYTQESKDLLQFWRDYVSTEYKEQRKQKLRNKDKFNSFMSDNGFEQGNSLAPSPKKHKSMVYMGVDKDKFKRTPGKPVKAPVKLTQNGVMSKYEEYGTCFELDVEYSLQKDIKRRLDREKQQQLQREMSMKTKEENEKKQAQIKKINAMLKTYFDDIAESQMTKKAQELKIERDYLEPDKKDSKDSPMPVTEPKRPASAAPKKAQSMKVKTENQKIYDAECDKIKMDADKNRKNLASIMLTVHDYCFMEYQQYESRKENHEKQKQAYYASQNENKRKGGKSIVMTEPGEFKQKAPPILPIDSSEVLSAFKANKAKSNCQLDDTQVSGILSEFFQPFNKVKRILLYRDVINKSKIRGMITIHSFYLNTRPQDQQLYMFQFKPGSADDNAAKVIKEYEIMMAKQAEDRQKRLQEKESKKKDKYDTHVLKQVFGERFNAENGQIELKNRPDYTQPKDKWKLGKQLKELQREFPHDRVIQRMVEQEYKTNQPFMHPEMYDLFNQAEELAFKKNFTGKTREMQKPGKPALEKQIENDLAKITAFKEKDESADRGMKHKLHEDLKKQANLEYWLQKTAKEYREYMITSAGRAEKKTLRARLAEFYQDMIKRHGDVAKKRFPHLAYGQDPNSETFKKSFPQSFKRYFCKIVKSIVMTKKGKEAKICLRQATLIMAVGAREAKLQDPVGGVKSMNTRLNATKIGAHIQALKKIDPKAWRSRAMRRKDMVGKLKNVFMQFSELENCTFEPKCGVLADDTLEEKPPGTFIKEFGNNFEVKNPQLFKYGKIKQARAQIRTGKKGYIEVLKTLAEAMNLMSILEFYRPDDCKVFVQGKKILSDGKDDKGLGHSNDKPKTTNSQEDTVLKQHQNITPEDLRDINEAFEQFRMFKKDIDNKLVPVEPGVIKIDKLGLAMRKVKFTPGPVELQEIEKEINTKNEKALVALREYSKKSDEDKKNKNLKPPPPVQAGVDREWFTRIISSKMRDFQSDNELKEAFKILDEDNSGQIDREEFTFVMKHLDQGFTEKEIDEMVNMADKDRNGTIDQDEFIAVMKSQGGGRLKGQNVMNKMRTELKRFLQHKKLIKQFKNMKPHIKWIFEEVNKINEDKMRYLKNLGEATKKRPVEEFNQSMFDDVWEILQIILKQADSNQKTKKLQDQSKKLLNAAKKGLKEQKEMGFDAPVEGEEKDLTSIDFRKIFKTIMCPLKDSCPKKLKQRWPYTLLKTHEKLGKDCPYAHHAMELAFPQTINMRLKANEKIMAKAEGDKRMHDNDFTFSGGLKGCQGCGNRCNLCQFNSKAKEMENKFTSMKTTAAINPDKVAEKNAAIKENDEIFKKKFGMLKKASVLLQYDRPIDAFDEIKVACKIIQEQNEKKKESEADLQKKWQLKLGLQEGMELPKKYEEITPEDVTDDFLKKIDSGNADIATLKLYISKVCPLVRSAFDRDAFLNGLIEELYLKCEDIMKDKQKAINDIVAHKNKLADIHEQMEGMGSDVEKQQTGATMHMTDANGNKREVKRKRGQILVQDSEGVDQIVQRRASKMCESVQKRKTWKEDGVGLVKHLKDGTTVDKYYVDTTLHKSNTLGKDGKMQCQVCPKGCDCNKAHTAIELNLTDTPRKIKNLNKLIKSQTANLKTDRPIQPWKPASKDFQPDDLPQFGKKPAAEKDQKKKKRGILERENVFRKPFDKE